MLQQQQQKSVVSYKKEGMKESNHLRIASLHMSQCYFWMNRMTTGDTENLEVCVLAITFIHLKKEHTLQIKIHLFG